MTKKIKRLRVIKKSKTGGIRISQRNTTSIKRIGVVAVDSGTICIVDPFYGAEATKLERADIEKKKFTIVSKQLRFTKSKAPFAVIHITGIGDGFFPVDAEYEGRHVRRVVVQLPGDIDWKVGTRPLVPRRRRIT